MAGTVNDQNRINLAAGSYTVIVTDAAGCRDTVENINVLNSCVTTICTMKARASALPKTCQTLGSIAVAVSGGNAPYTYKWSDLITPEGVRQPQNRANLPSGIYFVTVADSRGCDTVLTNIIVRNEAVNCGGTVCTLRATVSATPKTCQTGGSISVNTNGGTSPITFRWSDLITPEGVSGRSGIA